MLDLDRRGRDVRAFVRALEDWLIAALAALGVAGERRDGQVGIFVGNAKIASIGIRVRRWVSYHGVSLNVDPDLRHFAGIVPCGLASPVTSLAALGAETNMARVDAALRASFDAVFDATIQSRVTLKPSGTEPLSPVMMTLVTRASGGPRSQRFSISATLSAGPENAASTLPSRAFRTQPSRPSARAVSSVQAR